MILSRGGGARVWLGVFLLLVAHFTLRPLIVHAPVAPNLLVGGLLLAALRMRAGSAALLGFVLGVLEASMALEGLGETALVLAVIGYTAARSRDLLFADMRAFVPIYLVAGTWIAQAGILLFVYGAGDAGGLLFRAPVDALLTAVVCGAAEAGFASPSG